MAEAKKKFFNFFFQKNPIFYFLFFQSFFFKLFLLAFSIGLSVCETSIDLYNNKDSDI